MKSLCHTCYTSNLECVLSGQTGNPICEKCIIKNTPKIPELKCNCKDCEKHNPTIKLNDISTNEAEIVESVD